MIPRGRSHLCSPLSHGFLGPSQPFGSILWGQEPGVIAPCAGRAHGNVFLRGRGGLLPGVSSVVWLQHRLHMFNPGTTRNTVTWREPKRGTVTPGPLIKGRRVLPNRRDGACLVLTMYEGVGADERGCSITDGTHALAEVSTGKVYAGTLVLCQNDPPPRPHRLQNW